MVDFYFLSPFSMYDGDTYEYYHISNTIMKPLYSALICGLIFLFMFRDGRVIKTK